jgi:hypothetical protein
VDEGGTAPTPRPWPPSGERKCGADGNEYELRARAVDVDPLDQTFSLEIQAEKWREGQLIARERHSISMRMYFRNELQLMLERAGFSEVDVRGDYTDQPAAANQDFLVYLARK